MPLLPGVMLPRATLVGIRDDCGPQMSPSIAIDVHAHMLPAETIRLLGKESPRVAPKLSHDNGAAIMEIAGKVVQRPMPPQVYDLDLRLRDMDRHGVTMQLIAATVHTFF